MPKCAEDVYETEWFTLYKDPQGKFWLWNKVEEVNHAMRASSEIEAYRNSVDSLAFMLDMVKAKRAHAYSQLETLREAFEEVFGGEDD